MDINMRINLAKTNLQKAATAKTVAETQKANAEAQLKEVEQQMMAEGVTPDTIGDVIAQLQSQVEQDLQRVESLIPRV
ncbi:MAG TPA: hypothetical protein VEZ13_10700 [Brevibacillus sp.]|nr:hypothetical protein [Brevibacillus sp.]